MTGSKSDSNLSPGDFAIRAWLVGAFKFLVLSPVYFSFLYLASGASSPYEFFRQAQSSEFDLIFSVLLLFGLSALVLSEPQRRSWKWFLLIPILPIATALIVLVYI